MCHSSRLFEVSQSIRNSLQPQLDKGSPLRFSTISPHKKQGKARFHLLDLELSTRLASPGSELRPSFLFLINHYQCRNSGGLEELCIPLSGLQHRPLVSKCSSKYHLLMSVLILLSTPPMLNVAQHSTHTAAVLPDRRFST